MALFSNPISNLGWKVGAIGAVALNLVIGFFMISAQIERDAVEKQRDQLQLAINDPVTGYVARLTTAQNNVATLKKEVERQNETIRNNAALAAERLARTKAELALAQRESSRLQKQVDAFLAQKIEGDTLEERVLDVDRRAMEEFLNNVEG